MGLMNKLKNWIKGKGAKIGMIDTLSKITDHPKIGIPEKEYARIQENKRVYSGDFPRVIYENSNNELQSREFNSINTPKVMAKELVKYVLNEGFKISVDDDEANKFLQDIFKDTKFHKNFGEELEAGYAISGLVLRPYFDSNSKKIKISYCSADCFYPLHSNTNDIAEAAITTTTQQVEGNKTYYYTLLEFHEWKDGVYCVTNELYRSDSSDEVGMRVSLNSLDKYVDLKEKTYIENLSRPLFIYIKLAGKNNITLGSPLGLGIIDNAKTQINNINDKYDQFMHEVEEAGRKIIIPDAFAKVKYHPDGSRTNYFDKRTTVYQKLRSDKDELHIKEFAPSLRSGEFIETINFILQITETLVGFSPGTFTFDGKSIKTATEVTSENSKSFRTRSENVKIIEEAMKELVITIFELAKIYRLYKGSMGFGINIDFDDGVFVNKEAQLDYYGAALTYGVIPKAEVIQRQFGVTDKEAEKWLDAIEEEKRRGNPTIEELKGSTTLFGSEEE